MRVKRVSTVAGEPITLDQAKGQLSIVATDTTWDTQITGLIAVVREVAENETSLDLRLSTYEMTLESFRKVIPIPHNPLKSVVSITYKDADGVEQTLPTADYTFETGNKASVYIKEPPETEKENREAVKITYTAGIDVVADVPNKTVQGMLLVLTHLFENRSEVVESRQLNKLPLGAEWLFQKDRVY